MNLPEHWELENSEPVYRRSRSGKTESATARYPELVLRLIDEYVAKMDDPNIRTKSDFLVASAVFLLHHFKDQGMLTPTTVAILNTMQAKADREFYENYVETIKQEMTKAINNRNFLALKRILASLDVTKSSVIKHIGEAASGEIDYIHNRIQSLLPIT